jgi:hypothetical protein
MKAELEKLYEHIDDIEIAMMTTQRHHPRVVCGAVPRVTFLREPGASWIFCRSRVMLAIGRRLRPAA